MLQIRTQAAGFEIKSRLKLVTDLKKKQKIKVKNKVHYGIILNEKQWINL
jgi:hypothetical protein